MHVFAYELLLLSTQMRYWPALLDSDLLLPLQEFPYNPIRIMIVSIQVHMPMSKKVKFQGRGLQYMMVHDIFSAYSLDFGGGLDRVLECFASGS
jgi:hypothetical protein